MKSNRWNQLFVLAFCVFLFLNSNACASKELKESAPVLPAVENSPLFGDVNAPVKIVEFTDFECHFCGQVQPVLQQVLQTHPKEVSLVFKSFPLVMHPHAYTAHLAVMCANEQGKFWEYRNTLFQNQRALKRVDLVAYAAQQGLNLEAFTQCLDEEKYASKIEADFNEGVRTGVMGTPTFFINGRPISGAQSFAAFEQLIQQALAERS